jgi:hypothetical protein
MQRRPACDQPDLFQVSQPTVQRGVMERAKLLPLLRRLLLEIVFGATAERPSKESNHE